MRRRVKKVSGALRSQRRKRILASDAEAIAAARLTDADLGVDAVAAIRIPALLYAGTLDRPEPVERFARMMMNATFVALDGLNHALMFGLGDSVPLHVRRFFAGPEVNAVTG